SISIGISTGIYHNEINKMSFVETLIQQANKAMYRVKEIGGKSYHLNTYADSKNVPRTYQVEAEIKNALEKNEFHIAYQPIITLKNKQIVSLEALLTWNNEYLGRGSPADFLSILEQQLRIMPVANWVLAAAAAQMSQWQEEGIFFERILANVSPIQLKSPTFIQDPKNIFNATHIYP